MPDAKALLLDPVAVNPDGNKSAVFGAEERMLKPRQFELLRAGMMSPDSCPVPGAR